MVVLQDEVRVNAEQKRLIAEAAKAAKSKDEFRTRVQEILHPPVKDPDFQQGSRAMTSDAAMLESAPPLRTALPSQESASYVGRRFSGMLGEAFASQGDTASGAADMIDLTSKYVAKAPIPSWTKKLFLRNAAIKSGGMRVLGDLFDASSEAIRTDPRGTYPIWEGIGQVFGDMAPVMGMAAMGVPPVALTGTMWTQSYLKEGASAYAEAVDKGATDDEAALAFLLYGSGAATIEVMGGPEAIMRRLGKSAVPFSKILGRINKETGGASGWLLRRIGEGVKSGAGEQGEEYAQLIWGKLVAKGLYDEDMDVVHEFQRDAKQMGLDPAIIGAIVGGAVGVGAEKINKRKGEGGPVLTDQKIEPAIVGPSPFQDQLDQLAQEQAPAEQQAPKQEAPEAAVVLTPEEQKAELEKLGEVAKDEEEAQKLREQGPGIEKPEETTAVALREPEPEAKPEVEPRPDLLTVPEPSSRTVESPPAPPRAVIPLAEGKGGAKPTSIKNEVVDQERRARGLPPMMEPSRRSFGEVWDTAMDKILTKIGIQDALIGELKKKPRAVTDVEDALLLHRQIELQNAYDKTIEYLDQAREAGDLGDVALYESIEEDQAAALLELYEITQAVGTETGRGLNARRMLANEDFSLARMLSKKRKAQAGVLSDEDKEQVKRKHREIKKADEDFEKSSKEQGERDSREGVKKLVREEGRRSKKEKQTGPPEVPSEINEKTLRTYAQKLARFYVSEHGIREVDPLVDAVHADLLEIVPDIERRATMDAISGYGVFSLLSRDEVSVILRDLKGQMQQLAKLEDMALGEAPKKTGFERRTPSDAERDLIKQVNEAKRQGGFEVTDPAKQLQSALAGLKTRLENQIRDLEKQIESREKIVKTRTRVERDAEALALEARRDDLKKQFEEIFGKPELTDEQRLARLKKSIQKRIDEYERRLREKDYSKTKRHVTPLDKEAEDMRFKAEKLKKQFLRELEADRRRNRTKIQKAFGTVPASLNLGRALVTSFDFSALLRQGKPMALAHPIVATRAIRDMFVSFRSEAGASRAHHEIENRPNTPLYKRSKLGLTAPDGSLSQQEEIYMSNLTQLIPVVAGSERAYVAMMNRQRADTFDALAWSLGREDGITDHEAELIANFINAASGRANLGRLTASAVFLNTVFFAPRWVWSRFQLLSGQPLWHPVRNENGNFVWKDTFKARRLIAKEYAKILTGYALYTSLLMHALKMLLGDDDDEVEMTLDRRSSDFGKIRIGNIRLDPLSGLSQVTVLGERLRSGETKSSTTGQVTAIRGKDVPYGRSDAAGVIGRFLRTKLSPVLGTGLDLASGTDMIGREVGAKHAAVQLAVPLSMRDIFEVMQSDANIPTKTALDILQIFGEGVQVYQDKATTGKKAR